MDQQKGKLQCTSSPSVSALLSCDAEFRYVLNAYVEAHIESEITVNGLCRDFGLSRSSLYALAKGVLDCSLIEYIRRQRMEYAKALLTETSMRVSDISSSAGFSDYTYFQRVFKQREGMSCTRYRRTARQVTVL